MSNSNNKIRASIELMSNGPLIVKGLKQVTDTKGNRMDIEKTAFALCRCGQSKNKPFCDGSHSASGFSDKREITRPLNKSRTYSGQKITIHDNRTICAHAAECTENLPSVFQQHGHPWINPDGAEVEKLTEVIKKCPSGALSYSLNENHYKEKDLPQEISVQKDGPYNIRGKINLNISDDLQPPNRELYSLCRCGASKNKPYCDGAHHEIGFKD